MKLNAKLIASEVSKMFGDGSDDILDAKELHPLIKDDPYAGPYTELS